MPETTRLRVYFKAQTSFDEAIWCQRAILLDALSDNLLGKVPDLSKLKIRKLLEQTTELNLTRELQFVILQRVAISFFKLIKADVSQLKNEDVRLAFCCICHGINAKMVELFKNSLGNPNYS
jgi:hypothetical protein